MGVVLSCLISVFAFMDKMFVLPCERKAGCQKLRGYNLFSLATLDRAVIKGFKVDFQSVICTHESLFTTSVLFYVRRHKM